MMAPAPSTTPHPAILYALPKDRVAGSLGDLVIKAQDEALRNEPSSLWPSLVVRWRKLWSMGSTVEMKSNGIDGMYPKTKTKNIFYTRSRLKKTELTTGPLSIKGGLLRRRKSSTFRSPRLEPSDLKFQDQRTIFIPSRLGTLMILKKWRMSTCEKQLMNEFAGKTAVAFPRFDLMPSGTGPEGHTCSLFPGYDLSKEDLALNNSPKPLSTRITPVLNYAHKVAFVAIGESKKESFETCSIILNQAFLPLSSNLSLLDKFVDEAAASQTEYVRTNFNL
ncbi:hypothetical protein PSTT_09151, partial [Puccinia striiformis]